VKKRILTIIAILIISIICLTSCSNALNNKTYFTTALNTGITWQAQFTSDTSTSDVDKIWSRVVSIINDYENRFSTYEENSFVYKFNNADAGERIEGDLLDKQIFDLSKEIFEKTNGAFNPAVYMLSRLWGFADENSINNNLEAMTEQDIVIPSQSDINSALSLTNFEDIVVEEENDVYYFTKPQNSTIINGVEYSMQIDLSGILKGYIAGKIINEIHSSSAKWGYISLGSSSIAVLDKDENGNYWNLTIKDPRNPSSAYLSIPMINTLLSTSGDYESYFEKDGVRYCHIINPFTGYPIQTGIMCASIMYNVSYNENEAILGAYTDAYSTAIMVMNVEDAKSFIRTNNLQATMCYKDGSKTKVFTTIKNSNLNNYEYC